MHSSVIRAAALLGFFAAPTFAQTPVSGVFITKLGNDTLSIERYTRSGDKLVGDLLMGGMPRVRVIHYVADLAPNGTIKAMTINTRPVVSDSSSPPMSSITTLFVDTIATVDFARNGVPDTANSAKKVYHGYAMPQVSFAPASYAVYEQILAASKLNGTDSVGYAVITPGRRPPTTIYISRHGRDTVYYNSTVFPGWVEVARVDAQGHILAVNSSATTVKTSMTRADKVDFDAIAKAWAANEAAHGVMSQMSPPDTVRSTVGAAKIEVAYSRPFKRGRVIFGSSVVPWNQVWRTGANAATQFTTSSDLMFGDKLVPAGKYTLWTLPTPTGAKLIINSQTGQWGTDYDASKDFARLDLTTKSLSAPVDQFTIAVVPQGSGGVLRFSWDTTEYSIPFTIK